MYEHILVPRDGSRLSNAAVEKTLAFAKEVSARVTLLSVLQPFHVEAEAVIRARLERAFKERIRRLEQQHAERIDQLK